MKIKKKPIYKKIFKVIYSPIRKPKRLIKKYKLRQIVKKDAIIINELIKKHTNKESPKLTYIIQETFFNISGEVFFSGGGERYALDLADILRDKGYSVILLQNGCCDGKWWYKKHKNLDVIGIPWEAFKEVREILSFLEKSDLYIYVSTLDYGKLMHPNIRISHGVTWDNFSSNVKNNYELYDRLLANADVFVSVDTNTISWFRSSLAKTIHESKKQLHYIPNYVDLDLFKPAVKNNKGRIKVTFPRRCSIERGYWEVSAILSKLLNTYSNVDFEFIGVPCQKNVLEDLKKLEAMFPRDRLYHRAVDADKMFEVYQNTDIAIIPTIFSEGTSLSCLESMASGNAIIATNIGGLPNLILHGYNGLLINPGSDELFNSLSRLIENETLRNTLSLNAIETSKAFSKILWRERWEEILKTVLDGNK